MGFSLFRGDKDENTAVARRERLDQVERQVAARFRQLSELLAKAAAMLEARRLERSGYERPESFLERADRKHER